MQSLVIVGGGHAAAQLCNLLVGAGRGSEVVLISDEPHLPYQRPPLSKSFLAKDSESLQFHKDAEWYARGGVQVHLGERVTAIDRAGRQIVLESGKAFPYGTLVLATGTAARSLATLPPHLSNVSTLRSAGDALKLRATLDSLREAGGALTVLGGGFIGLELAAVARQMGVEVCVLEGADRLLKRAVSSELSQIVLENQRAAEVNVVLKAAVSEFHIHGDRLTHITLGGQQRSIDQLVLAIGAAPQTSLAEQAGLDVGDGIFVDDGMRTSAPHILAIGDCTAFRSGRMRLESVQNAGDQARAAFDTLQGNASSWLVQPWFWSDQGSMKVQMAGLLPDSGRRTYHRPGPGPAPGSGTFFHYVGDELHCVESVNSPIDHMWGRKILASKANPSAQSVVDVAIALKTLL